MSARDATAAAAKYMAAIISIQGEKGSNACLSAATAAFRGFSLPEQIALDLLKNWNRTNATPLWSDAELQWKIECAKRSPKPDGFLLHGRVQGSHPRRAEPAFQKPALDQQPSTRPTWPRFHRLSVGTMEEFAMLRSLPVEGINIAHSLGILRGSMVPDASGLRRAIIITEGDFAQARALDGLPFTFRDGTQSKAKTLPGSVANGFVGKSTLGENAPVLLCEGAVSYVEGCCATNIAGAAAYQWTVLAAVSCGSKFANDPELLELMRGRRVRIIMDSDPAGAAAAGRWTAELRAQGCIVDALRLPPPAKDLGDMLALSTADSRAVIEQIFSL